MIRYHYRCNSASEIIFCRRRNIVFASGLLLDPLPQPSIELLFKMKTTWKDIAPVPTSQEFIDIVLSRTQRRLPTQIRAGFKISRIRGEHTRHARLASPVLT